MIANLSVFYNDVNDYQVLQFDNTGFFGSRTQGGLFARAGLSGYGITYFDDDNQIKQEPYVLVNARIGYEAEKFGIYLYANNLFDTRYITSGFLFPEPDGTAGFGDPVTYGVQFKATL